MMDEVAGIDIAELDNGRLENAGLDNDRLDVCTSVFYRSDQGLKWPHTYYMTLNSFEKESDGE